MNNDNYDSSKKKKAIYNTADVVTTSSGGFPHTHRLPSPISCTNNDDVYTKPQVQYSQENELISSNPTTKPPVSNGSLSSPYSRTAVSSFLPPRRPDRSSQSQSPQRAQLYLKVKNNSGTSTDRTNRGSAPTNSRWRAGGSASSSSTTRPRIRLTRIIFSVAFVLWIYSAIRTSGMMRRLYVDHRERYDYDSFVSPFRTSKRENKLNSYVVNSTTQMMEDLASLNGKEKVVPIFIPLESSTSDSTATPDRKAAAQIQQLEAMISSSSSTFSSNNKKLDHKFQIFPFSSTDQYQFLQRHGGKCLNDQSQHYQRLVQLLEDPDEQYSDLVQSLWKYCVLYLHGGIYMDVQSVILLQSPHSIFESTATNNVVIVNRQFSSFGIEESFLIWKESRSTVLFKVLVSLLESAENRISKPREKEGENDEQEQSTSALLYQWIQQKVKERQTLNKKKNKNSPLWTFLEQRCTSVEMGDVNNKFPPEARRRCQVYHPQTLHILMLTDAEAPFLCRDGECIEKVVTQRNTKPNFKEDGTDNMERRHPIHSVIVQEPYTPPKHALLAQRQSTPNFFQLMLENDCLPTNRHCKACLASKGTCASEECRSLCPCYCNAICNPTFAPRKVISRKYRVIPPQIERKQGEQEQRLIPRKIHQIWTDSAKTREGYPKMSRVVNSWNHSRWEYHFYDLDHDIPLFLQKHFPPEVLEAYNSLKPSRFKSDLARYCVLLIYGGLYAETDIILHVELDNAIQPDIGFMAVADAIRPKVRVDCLLLVDWLLCWTCIVFL